MALILQSTPYMGRFIITLSALLLIMTGASAAFAATKKDATSSQPKKASIYTEGTLVYALLKTPDALSFRFSDKVRFGIVPAKKQQVAMKISF